MLRRSVNPLRPAVSRTAVAETLEARDHLSGLDLGEDETFKFELDMASSYERCAKAACLDPSPFTSRANV